MTEQEAMEVLKQPCLCDYDLSNTVLDCDIKQCDKRDAVLQAIKALEEICQYRAIGTPEECRAAVEKQKEIKEAFEKWKNDTSGIYGADDETTDLIFNLKQILRSDEE